MPRIKKGEMNLTEIRNLVRQHNKVSTISGWEKKSRKALLDEIEDMGYMVDHAKKMIVKVRAKKGGEKAIKVGKEGEQKPNKTTRKKIARKKLIAGGDKNVKQGGNIRAGGYDEV